MLPAHKKIKKQVLQKLYQYLKEYYPDYYEKLPVLTDENIDEVYYNEDIMFDEQSLCDWACEFMYDFRDEYDETIQRDSQCSRYYECDYVAQQLDDGSWVGYNYWYGGGKHGDPSSIDWLEDAVNLKCTEKEVVRKIREFECLE